MFVVREWVMLKPITSGLQKEKLPKVKEIALVCTV